jgi:hypothetical protein
MSSAACISPIGPPDSTRRSVPAHQHAHAFVDLAHDVLDRDLAVFEHEFAGVGAAHAELVELLRRGEALHSLLDDEGGHAARTRRPRRRAHVDQQHVGVGAVGDPHLGPVRDPAVALELGAAGHRADHVGTGAGFAHGQRADQIAAAQAGNIFLSLFLCSIMEQVLHAQVGVRAVGQSDRTRCARDFLHRDEVGQVAQLGTAVFARHRHAEQAHLAELLPQVGREQVFPVDQVRARSDFLLRELAHRFTQEVEIFTEGKRSHAGSPSGRREADSSSEGRAA